MSGDTVGTAMDALFMVGGGLGFARLGWGGLNPRPARACETAQDGASPEQIAAPAAPSIGWQI
ncbi:MAG TPA: hypothetical protein VKI45_06880, partial [Allosphingosinicella sp.]|nr:hypothetical protein [Allosphingosinicella sp.]